MYTIGISCSTFSERSRKNSFSLRSCNSVRYRYLFRSSWYLSTDIRHNSNCSSCVLNLAGCSPCIPKACRSSSVKARPYFYYTQLFSNCSSEKMKPTLLSLGSRRWSMPITCEGVRISPTTSWYPRLLTFSSVCNFEQTSTGVPFLSVVEATVRAELPVLKIQLHY